MKKQESPGFSRGEQVNLHLHSELVPGCYRCDIRRHEAETIFAEQSACLHPTATCDECGAEIQRRTHLKEDQ